MTFLLYLSYTYYVAVCGFQYETPSQVSTCIPFQNKIEKEKEKECSNEIGFENEH